MLDEREVRSYTIIPSTNIGLVDRGMHGINNQHK